MDSTVHLKRRQGPVSEVVVAILGVGAALWAGRLPLPGVDYETMRHLLASTGSGPDTLADTVPHLGTLGIMPFIFPFAALEVAVAVWTFFKKKPEPGPAGRRNMTIVAFGLALVLACVQAAGIVTHLGNLHLMAPFQQILMGSPWVVGACLVAYSMAVGGIALVVSRLGIGDGFSLVILASLLSGAFHQGRDIHARLVLHQPHGPAVLPTILLITGVLTVLVIISILVLRTHVHRDHDPPVPMLASGALPAHVSATTVAIVSLVAMWLGADGLTSTTSGSPGALALALVHAAVTVSTAVLLAWLLRFPSRAAMSSPRLDRHTFRRRLVILGLASGALLLALHHATTLAERLPFTTVGLDAVRVLIVVAICMDLADRILFRIRLGFSPSAMEVAVYHSVYEADLASHNLRQAGIPHHVQGLFHRRVLYFVAAYVSMPVLVAETDVIRARIILRGHSTS